MFWNDFTVSVEVSSFVQMGRVLMTLLALVAFSGGHDADTSCLCRISYYATRLSTRKLGYHFDELKKIYLI